MSDSELVYSTGSPLKGNRDKNATEPGEQLEPHRITLTLRREKQGRRGKEVTTIDGLPNNEAFGRDLAKGLKAICGAGGTWKAGHIEIQGDHRDTVQRELEAKGFHVKRAGG